MPGDSPTFRVVIAGASSLRGKELKQLIEEGALPGAEVRLVDEEFAAGTLTEAGGEPAVIQEASEESFERARFVFFTGSTDFAVRHWPAAERAGATVIDLSGALDGRPGAVGWIPALDALLPPPRTSERAAGRVFLAPSSPTIVACSLAAALGVFDVERLALVFFQPASERGQAGIEELESQTIKLLSFQPIAEEVFDAQVAFNLLDRYGEASQERLADVRCRITREVRAYLDGRAIVPAVQLIQAPVFYSYAFTGFLELARPHEPDEFSRRLEQAQIKSATPADPAPSNVSVAGESRLVLGAIERDPNAAHSYWFWGAADNLRLAAANALSIAEKLLAP